MTKAALIFFAVCSVYTQTSALGASIALGQPASSVLLHNALTVAPRSAQNVTPIHYVPVFLGCVYSYHQCEHRAHGRGLYNHFIRHDHRTCHHGPSYACYAQ
jgi:hypothetical protein